MGIRIAAGISNHPQHSCSLDHWVVLVKCSKFLQCRQSSWFALLEKKVPNSKK